MQIQQQDLQISQACSFTQRYSEDYMLLKQGLTVRLEMKKQKILIIVTWNFPPAHYVKLNVDGSSIGNPGPSGGGNVL